MGTKMGEKTMLLEQAFAIAHGAVMALDEDALVGSVIGPRRHDTGRGKRARAHGEDARRLAELREIGREAGAAHRA